MNNSISNTSGGGRCSFNCTGMQYSTGSLVTNKIDECACLTYFEWNTTDMACNINCTSISFAVGSNGTNNTCICDPKFIFTYLSTNVPACLLSCPLINNTAPTNSTTLSLVCPCRNAYIWNSSAL